jgi:hypothetical protein
MAGNPSARAERAPRILFLTPNVEDYLADSLFHGLRTLLGDRVVDYPKSEIAYTNYGEERVTALYGRGFTLYGLLEDLPIERNNLLDRIGEGRFDAVVFADIWRRFGTFVELFPTLGHAKAVALDGHDSELVYPYAPKWARRPQWWSLPRAGRRVTYFKRELTRRSQALRFLPGFPRLRPIAFSIPEEKIIESPIVKRRDFPTHIVDGEVAQRLGRESTSYAFGREADYYRDLAEARFGITTKRAGWDCLRHYEIAANGTVPCFRNLDRKPPSCAPHGLDDGNCVSYRDYDDLMRKLVTIDDERYASLQAGALDWARANTTVRRAGEFLAALELRP